MNRLSILCFVSAARTKSFSASARELHITQQAVSRHIRSLEEELGYPLFFRNTQTVHLTRAGEKMLRYCEEREQLLSDVMEHFRSYHAAPPLRIAWSQWLGAPEWFRQAIRDFGEAYPQIRITASDLNAEEMRDALQNEEVDLLLTTAYAAAYLPVLWNATKVGHEKLVLLGSRRVNYDFSDCSAYPYFAASAGESNRQAVLRRAQKECERAAIRPRNIEICPNMGSVCLNVLVQGGLALGVAGPAVVRAEEFVCHPTGQEASVVLCRPLRQKRKEAALFEEFLLERMEVAR
ncbi:MAG: LysR family transcriptional regulator [Oscillospiraceae bacterium]|nr:LysR family transcriptional regulator [Oscillospiraceae bacterium]